MRTAASRDPSYAPIQRQLSGERPPEAWLEIVLGHCRLALANLSMEVPVRLPRARAVLRPAALAFPN